MTISFTRLGQKGEGRFGNQLFQYAYLRTEAQKLNTTFYCPDWLGDYVFNLNDENERLKLPAGVSVNELKIDKNNRDIWGYYESEGFFDKDLIKRIFDFKADKIKDASSKYSDIDFNNSTALHFRFGDKFTETYYMDMYYIPRVKYYVNALLEIFKTHENSLAQNLLIFSDDIFLAKKEMNKIMRKFLRCITKQNSHKKPNIKIIFMENNKDYEDLFLMSLCKNIICAPSTFSWWAGYLNKREDKTIVFPKEKILRPKTKPVQQELIPMSNNWILIPALYPVVDNYYFVRYIKLFHVRVIEWTKIILGIKI